MLPPERIAQTGVVARDLAGEQRGDRRGAGALDEELRPLEQQHDRVADLLVGDGDDVVEQLLEDRGGERARLLDRDPLGDRVAGARCRPRRGRCSPPERRRSARPA